MNSVAPDKTKSGILDVEKVLFSKNPALAKTVPRFVINYLKRIVHQDDLNVFLEKYSDHKDAKLVEAFLNHFSIKYNVYGAENLPEKGKYIFVSNHPLGGLDGIIFMYEVSKYFPDLKFPVNDILINIKNLSGFFLPVNKHGSQGRDAALKIEEAYASDSQILYFPAGLCSRKRKGVISDLDWHKSFINKSVQYHRDVIPAYFSGRNSNFFYNLANLRKMIGIKANIEMLYLPDEMFRQKGQQINLIFGKPVPWETFDKTRSATEWAAWVKSETYKLKTEIC